MHTSLNSRLKALEKQAGPVGECTLIFLPEEDGAPPDPEVRRRWEDYLTNGPQSGSQVIVYPADYEVVRCADGTRVIVREVEGWYGNDAHERDRERVAVEVRPGDDVDLPQIVFVQDWFGNADLIQERMAERAAAQASPADGSGTEQPQGNASAAGPAGAP